MRTLRQRLTLLFSLSLIAIIAVACGGDSDNPDPTATSVAEIPTTSFDVALIAEGETLFGRFNCTQCHSVDGQDGNGPALNGIFGTNRELTDGTIVLVDLDYLRTSISDPNAQIVDGYPPAVMAAALSGIQAEVNDPATLDALVAYIASLPPTP
jgi:cytochrome c oxidase subunit 2